MVVVPRFVGVLWKNLTVDNVGVKLHTFVMYASVSCIPQPCILYLLDDRITG
jgi:hypothetical protein